MRRLLYLYYINPRIIIVLEESDSRATTIWKFEFLSRVSIRKRITRTLLNEIFDYLSIPYICRTCCYFNRNRQQTIMTNREILLYVNKHLIEKIDRLGKPQILIYE